MDRKIAVLTGLVELAQESKISTDVIRDLRNIIILLDGEIISEDDYMELVEELDKEKYIQKDGDAIYLTREGIALYQSIADRILGQTSLENLRGMIANYKKDQKLYLKNISVNIKSLHGRREEKTKDEDMSQVQAIGFVLGIEHKNVELFVHRIKIASDLLRDEDALSKEINASVHKLSKDTGLPILASRRDLSDVEIISFIKMKSFRLFSQEYEVFDSQSVNHNDVPGWNMVVASVFLEHGLNSLGYIRSRWPGRDFIKYNDFQQKFTNLGNFRECKAFAVDFKQLINDKIFVWLQSYISPSKRLSDFIKENLNASTSDRILDVLSNLKIKNIPSGLDVHIKNVLLGIDVIKEKIPSLGLTYVQFWKNTYGIVLSEGIQPVVVVQGKETDYFYPAETLFVEKYSLEKFFNKTLERKVKAESPSQRAHKSLELFDALKQFDNQEWDEKVCINCEECNPTLKYLHLQGAIEKTLRIHQPMLEFSSGAISLDPANIFNKDYGAKCGHKNIFISYFIAPTQITEAQIGVFLRGLQKAYSFAGFGSINKSPDMKIIKFDEKDKTGFENNIRELENRKNESNNIGIAVIPIGHEEIYYSVKRLFPSRVGIPIQAIAQSSVIESQDDKFRGFKLLCLKILIKSLKPGEAIWTLSDNAGLLPAKSLYIGIGFSAFPREGKVSKCAAVLHDSKGNKVSWKVFATVQTRTINKQWFDALLDKLRDIVDLEKPERLIFYRTGTLFPVELDSIKLSLASCDWIKTIKFCFVSIFDATNNRFFLTNNYKNLPAGYAIILNNLEGLISSSNYDDRELRQGTIVPVRLRQEIGKESIIDILNEYHDLTYLNWPAPFTTAKHPLVITIAERFSELTRENVPTENMFYLDL